MGAILEIKDLKGGYGDDEIVKGVSFAIERGSFLGIIGPNGSGKSTMLKMLSRALKPLGGYISYDGKDISTYRHKEYSKRVAIVTQDVFIDFPFTAREIALMGRIPHLGRLQAETKKDKRIADDALVLTGSYELRDKFINELSAGERQRVMLAKALAQEPELLLLDEPTSHLDIGHQMQVLDLLKRLNKERGLTVIIIIHDLNLAGEYCGRMILINEGRISKDGAPAEVPTYQNIEDVYRTVVVVRSNPVTSKPYVLPIPKDFICERN